MGGEDDFKPKPSFAIGHDRVVFSPLACTTIHSFPPPLYIYIYILTNKRKYNFLFFLKLIIWNIITFHGRKLPASPHTLCWVNQTRYYY